MKPIALQLYTLREECQRDFPGTLRRVAEIGYKGVEFAGLHGMSAREVAKLVADLGLQVASSHVGLPTEHNVEQLIEEQQTLGSKYIVTGLGPDDFATVDLCKSSAARFQKAAKLLEGSGLVLGVHNHWWEFEPKDGQLPYDILMAEAPDVVSELDIYWAATGGSDPAKVVAANKRRIPLLHVKDGPLVKGEPHTAVGSGKLDIPGIIHAADPMVLKWLIVELDACATDMVEAVAQSYRYLTVNGLAEGNR